MSFDLHLMGESVKIVRRKIKHGSLLYKKN